MHAAFIPYGARHEVDFLLRDMEAQKFFLKFWKKTKIKKIIACGQLRVMPLGVYEYVFPKEYKDVVLHTLGFDQDRYSLGRLKLAFLRKALKLEKIPKYKKKEKFPWLQENVNIIPIGIREDCDIIDENGNYKGWGHEAL